MEIKYGPDKGKVHTFAQMMMVAQAGEVWAYEPPNKSGPMYAIMVENRHREVDCIISSNDKLVALGDVGYNNWKRVKASGIRIEP